MYSRQYIKAAILDCVWSPTYREWTSPWFHFGIARVFHMAPCSPLQVALLHGPRRVMIVEPVGCRRTAAAEGGMGPSVVVGSSVSDVDGWTRGRGAGKTYLYILTHSLHHDARAHTRTCSFRSIRPHTSVCVHIECCYSLERERERERSFVRVDVTRSRAMILTRCNHPPISFFTHSLRSRRCLRGN